MASGRDRPSSERTEPQGSFQQTAPTATLQKGGGAIRGIGEKFGANPVTGTGSMSLPIATSSGRSGFGPQLSLSYDSGAGNGPFGFGWSLSLPSITRKTDRGIPQYLDAAESDVFMLSGSEDLVPVYRQDLDGSWVAGHAGFARDAEGSWVRDPFGRLVVHEDDFDGHRVRRYRPRTEGLFARIERWCKIGQPADVHWRSISKDNILTIYGQDAGSRIADPLDASRIFSWLICETRDDKGNGIRYIYKAEDGRWQPRPGQADPFKQVHQFNRGEPTDPRRATQRYLHRILYGNRRPLLDAGGNRPRHLSELSHPPTDGSADWLFEVRFDYGELDADDPAGKPERPWLYRPDAFSSYRSGFEVRTCRRCERVLMLHHIPDQPAIAERPAQPGYRGVVRSTDFVYDDEIDPNLSSRAVYSFLQQAVQTGWTTEGGIISRRSLPPVEFDYSKPEVQDTVEDIDADSLRNLPGGLDGPTHRWVDLHGEGVSGILVEEANAWFYKRNLSPLPRRRPDGSEVVEARLAALETVAVKPNASLGAGAEIMDLAGDGQPDLVQLQGPTPGFFEHDDGEGWHTFRPFTSRLERDLRDPNVRLIDLDGDGHADVLITENAALVWHPSQAEAGFGPARRVPMALDEEMGPRVVFADASQSIYLADLSGDGLTDIVRIRNGDVCYWPNLGHGRFGAKITMDHAPWFDNVDQFDQRRIRLADIDGSGTTDIIYLHRDGVRLYFNQSGNGWSQPVTLRVSPRVDDMVRIVPVDLLGNGTACLVWSSSLPGDARQPMRYVSLMGRQKPHLLVRTVNNLGAETLVDYAPSSKFYLQDRRDGRPWITRLPFPVHVVERVEIRDHVSRSRFVTRYAYHHGHFDGEEREFRGFGMVEQWDTERYAALAAGTIPADNVAAPSHVPAVRTRTWFHTGAYLGRDRISRQYEGEYFREPGATPDVASQSRLDDTILPPALPVAEAREACRALKGSMLRQEVYADDADTPGATAAQRERARTPYVVTEQSFGIRVLQARGANRHAVFFTHPLETLSLHYERNPSDPRIQHALTLEVDDFGNSLKHVVIGYGRASSPLSQAWDRDRQTGALLTYAENAVTNAVSARDIHRAPLPCQAVTYELTGYTPTGRGGRFFQAADFVEPDATAPGRIRHRFSLPEVPYEQTASGSRRRRPIEWQRTLYRRDDLAGLLPLGELQPMALPGESYKLAFTPGLVVQVFKRPRPGQADEPLLPNAAAVLGGSSGGYLQSQSLKADGRFPASDGDGQWWIASGRSFYSALATDTAAGELATARAHFFVPRRYRDPFGSETIADLDAFDLLLTETRDALANRTTVEVNDYRTLQPRLISDPNRNRTEVAFDALGMVVGKAVMGKFSSAPPEGDTLAGFVSDLTQVEIEALCDSPDPRTGAAELLKDATSRVVYDLDRFRRTQQAHPDDPASWQPACTATLAREAHVGSRLQPQGSGIQLSFSYSDGFGREIQKKVQAEPGRLDVDDDLSPVADPRWVASGWTIFNNKGKPVRQYEPFFSASQRYEFGVLAGVSSVLFYDPTDRVIATLHPNHTYEKVVFDPWQQTTFDVNDTCAARNGETGDPRTDRDIGGYVAAYFETQPAAWQTWHGQRIGGALGTDEQTAAARAAAHADTPTTAHFDAVGRPFLTISRNRVVCSGHDLDGSEDSLAARVELDIEGNQRAVRDAVQQGGDALGRIVARYAYDMLGNRIHEHSMEAGARWMLSDGAGKPLRSWDSRGHDFATTYDVLRRPLQNSVRGTSARSDPRTLNREIIVSRIEYGEALAGAEALNLRGRIYRQSDSAGVTTNARLGSDGSPVEAFDFKGNLLASTRQLVSDYTGIPDWSAQQPQPALETEAFEAGTRYDALDRPIQMLAPRSSLGRGAHTVLQPVFNAGNLLKRIDVWLDRPADPGGLLDPADVPASRAGVADIDYDASGRRRHIAYKNGARTSYTYDALTRRLTQLVTRRVSPAFPGDDPAPPIPAWPGKHVQSLTYTYDPAGNVTHIRDDAQQTVYFRNKRVEPSCDYTYDALYRLIEANGREHLGQGGTPIAHSHDDAGRIALVQPGDGTAMGTYVERYVYDAVGNFLSMQHRGSDPAHPGWIRGYTYDERSLIEDGSGSTVAKTSNRLTSTTLDPNGGTPQPEAYLHDAHGNIVRMPHLGSGGTGANMHWDYADRLLRVDKGGGGTAFYVYDAAGQRVRKVWEKSAGVTEERIYLAGFEVFRRHAGAIGAAPPTLERETLHVMDDASRIALVETRTLGTEAGNPRRLIRYQLGNHLGSASLELDEAADIISYEEYAPYGTTTYQAVRSQTETPKRYRYTGKERDEESGFGYHAARYYAPWLGRWVSPDPAGLVDGPDLYRYARDNPTNLVDVKGRQAGPWEPYVRQRRMVEAVNETIGPTVSKISATPDAVLSIGKGLARTGVDIAVGSFKFITGILGASWQEEVVAETVHSVVNLPEAIKSTADNWDKLSLEEKTYRLSMAAALLHGGYKAARGTIGGLPKIAGALRSPAKALFVGPERAAEFARAADLQKAGVKVTAVNNPDSMFISTGKMKEAAKPLTESGGKVVEGKVQDLSPDAKFDLIVEEFPQPLGNTSAAVAEANARFARMTPEGKMMVTTENYEVVDIYKGIAKEKGLTVNETTIKADSIDLPTYLKGKIDKVFRLEFSAPE